MSGPEMLLQAALKAFVPKETAERLTTAIEGMLRDGTLDGIGSLVSDIAEIKASQRRIEFGLAKIFALVQGEQQVHARRTEDGLPGSAGLGPVETVARNDGPLSLAGPGDGDDAGREPDGVRGGDTEGIAGHEGMVVHSGNKDAAE